MPWYKSGTVSVVLNSNAVIGAGTAFIANSRVGDAFRGPDGGWYEVTNIASDTAMSISPNYQGASNAAGAYALAPMQGYVKDSADTLRSLVNLYGAKLAALGTTGNYDILPANKGGTGISDLSGFIQGMLNDADAPAARATLVAAKSGANNDITAITGLTTALALNMGGTGRSDGRAVLSEVGVSAAAALFGTQGLYMGWNAASQGEGHFVVNRGGGVGGFTWRSVDAANTATGPSMSYSYGGLLTTPTLAAGIATLGAGSVVGSTSVAPGAANFQVTSNQGRIILTQGTALNSIQSVNPANSGYLPLQVVCTNFYNDIDGGANLGNGSKRWGTVFAITGAINTSDAREKTPVSPMSDAEISASIALAKEIGSFKWLASVAEKGADARAHIGMTVQRAIEVMESFGLAPLNYAFVCYDEWPAVAEEGYESIRGNIYSVGEKIFTDVEISEFDPYKEFSSYMWEETSRSYVVTRAAEPAGNRFGFRHDQLALFIARGQEERLARIEARLDALNS